MQRPIIDRCNNEKKMDNDKLNNMRKCFSIIDAFTLGEALGNQTGFVSLDGTVRFVFNFENPFTSNWTMTNG